MYASPASPDLSTHPNSGLEVTDVDVNEQTPSTINLKLEVDKGTLSVTTGLSVSNTVCLFKAGWTLLGHDSQNKCPQVHRTWVCWVSANNAYSVGYSP